MTADWDQGAAIEALADFAPKSSLHYELLREIGTDPTSGPIYVLTTQGRALLDQLRSAFFPVMGDYMRDFIEGMSVSVDVSTCDEDEGHRYFGTVTEVMDDPTDKHGVTLLVQDAKPNFEFAQSKDGLMVNGMTEAETATTASVAGLSLSAEDAHAAALLRLAQAKEASLSAKLKLAAAEHEERMCRFRLEREESASRAKDRYPKGGDEDSAPKA